MEFVVIVELAETGAVLVDLKTAWPRLGLGRRPQAARMWWRHKERRPIPGLVWPDFVVDFEPVDDLICDLVRLGD